MNLSIAGMGWVTPLGGGLDEVWRRLLNGDGPEATAVAGPFGRNSYFAFHVPETALSNLIPQPRLRRASAISRFAVAAGLAALDDAKNKSKIDIEKTALVFAVSNGGVSYTKRFYHEIVKTGASAASPLLFPETVFNAPASHLAAVLGLTGSSYTVVGDGAIGILAIKMAHDLMADDAFDCCLVVGAEEADWILCDAYHNWRLTRGTPPVEPFAAPPRGTILSEGAGALLLRRDGPIKIDKIDAGGNFAKRGEADAWAKKILRNLDASNAAVVVTSANGTFVDNAERSAIQENGIGGWVYSPKPALGEAVGASGLWQTMIAALALRTGKVPPVLNVRNHVDLRLALAAEQVQGSRAVVLGCGLNQQIAGLSLSVNA